VERPQNQQKLKAISDFVGWGPNG